jgi:hypothetical protein
VREVDHSPPSSAEVKNAWSYTSTPQNVFMAWCLVKHRYNFNFTFSYNVHTGYETHPTSYPELLPMSIIKEGAGA